MRKCIAVLIVFFAFASVSLAAKNPFVSYDVTETKRSSSDHRECITQIFLAADGYVGYRYREDVHGSITPTVQSLAFSNEYRRKATIKEQNELVRELLEANVFGLASETKPAKWNYYSHLDVRLNDREATFFFYSPPQSSSRKTIHEIMANFAKRMKVDVPTDKAKTITTTEGDQQPARQVQLAEVLAHPEKYHGKRISVVGYYHGEFEGNSLSVDEQASRSNDYKRSVWRSEPSTFADKAAIKDKNNSWLRVEGVFLRGPGGHLSLWPGEIVRLTRVEPVPKPR